MPPSSGKNKSAEFKPAPGLLPWQVLLLFAVIGLFYPQYPLPALLTACLLLCSSLGTGYRARPAFLVAVIVVFMLGLLLSLNDSSVVSPRIPDWMKARKKVEILGAIHRVSPKPNNRLQIILKGMEFRSPGAAKFQVLPGRCVWTWDQPAFWPAPGQRVRAGLRLKPIRGRQNFGAWDPRRFWGRKKVRYRTYSKGGKTDIEILGPVPVSWSWRMSLRETVLRNTGEGPGQGLLLALLMGDRSKSSYQTLDLVRRASLAHSLALSGLHLGFV
ncbi:MAG: ComEC/Rec2 family competence protein, partial [Desulfohalobiaceae bacterium]|nr:ComEC/Rec2 family competence protein [Desulfohalobiaceae bacterium]